MYTGGHGSAFCTRARRMDKPPAASPLFLWPSFQHRLRQLRGGVLAHSLHDQLCLRQPVPYR